jgi:hypothetical protein
MGPQMSMQKGQLPCGKCGGPVEIELQAKPSIVNREHVSLLIVEHSSILTCPHCFTRMLPVMVSVAGVAIVLTPAIEESLVITPGNETRN